MNHQHGDKITSTHEHTHAHTQIWTHVEYGGEMLRVNLNITISNCPLTSLQTYTHLHICSCSSAHTHTHLIPYPLSTACEHDSTDKKIKLTSGWSTRDDEENTNKRRWQERRSRQSVSEWGKQENPRGRREVVNESVRDGSNGRTSRGDEMKCLQTQQRSFILALIWFQMWVMVWSRTAVTVRVLLI